MPRDNDRHNSRPPGRRGPPSRDGASRGDKGARSEGRGGGGYRKRDDAPRGEGRSSRPAARFGDKKPSRSFGDRKPSGERKPYAGKSDFRKDGERAPRRDFKRDGAEQRPARSFSDRPKRDFSDRPKRDFSDRPKRDFADRAPRSGARDGDSRPKRDFKPRTEGGYEGRPRSGGFRRDDARGDFKRGEGRTGDRPPRREFNRDGDRPRRDFKERSAGSDKAGNDKPWRERSSAPRGDARRDGPSRGARSDSRPPREGRSFDRPRGDRPDWKPREDRGGGFGDRPRRDDRGGDRKDFRPKRDGERPRFSRDRDDDRPARREDRPERSPTPHGKRAVHIWRDHPRTDETDESSRGYERRPAFGGRGEYRERDSRRREPEAPPKPKKAGERIAKLMARAGLCSRRDAEAWVRDGRVSVNGRLITSPALDVTSDDKVLVDGAPLPERERTRLFLYHKPKGLVTTHSDPEGRPTVFESLPEDLPRLISIGRLDFNTEGLLLLTNDGGLARVLELPETAWMRRYRVRAHGAITQEKLDELRNGVEVDGVKYGPIEASLERDQGANVWILFAIREGKNREVRNVMAHLGLEVNRLIRVSYGPFQLGEIPEGTVEEVRSRLLRDQLGERIAAKAGAEFGLPAEPESEPARQDKPRKRAGVVADRKGRRVVVERSGSSDDSDAPPKRKPPAGYKGKRGRAPRDD
jgi:23S rRNA pseudouridine2605 synthase